MVAVGIVFGIIFAKEAFGGTGHNVYNPALVARCFLYICFPARMTGQVWPMPYRGLAGGFLHWSHLDAHRGLDALTAATAASAWKNPDLIPPDFSIWEMLTGGIPGCIGETHKILIILGAVFLILIKVADWRLVVSPILGALSLSVILYILSGRTLPAPYFTITASGLLFGAAFMVTDPVSAPTLPRSKWVYGVMIGIITVLIRVYSKFPQGLMFAILLMNTFAAILDYAFRKLRYRKRRAA
jgi:Na+-transporting NADH:ubiquinone oxidoreductase subunit B